MEPLFSNSDIEEWIDELQYVKAHRLLYDYGIPVDGLENMNEHELLERLLASFFQRVKVKNPPSYRSDVFFLIRDKRLIHVEESDLEKAFTNCTLDFFVEEHIEFFKDEDTLCLFFDNLRLIGEMVEGMLHIIALVKEEGEATCCAS